MSSTPQAQLSTPRVYFENAASAKPPTDQEIEAILAQGSVSNTALSIRRAKARPGFGAAAPYVRLVPSPSVRAFPHRHARAVEVSDPSLDRSDESAVAINPRNPRNIVAGAASFNGAVFADGPLLEDAIVDGPLKFHRAVFENASVLGPSPLPPLARYSVRKLRSVYEANVFAPLALVQLVLPRFAPRARIVNVVSPAAFIGHEGASSYAASKGGLVALTKSLAREVARFTITVNAVSPGLVDTQLVAAVARSRPEPLR